MPGVYCRAYERFALTALELRSGESDAVLVQIRLDRSAHAALQPISLERLPRGERVGHRDRHEPHRAGGLVAGLWQMKSEDEMRDAGHETDRDVSGRALGNVVEHATTSVDVALLEVGGVDGGKCAHVCVVWISRRASAASRERRKC